MKDRRTLKGVNSNESSSDFEISDRLLKSSDSNSNSSSDDARSSSFTRPPISYAMLITEAIQSSPEKQLVLSDIYDFVQEHYPYFKDAGAGWKNSIRHNLSLNKAFCRVPKPNRAPGKGSFWRLNDSSSASKASHRRLSEPFLGMVKKSNGPLRDTFFLNPSNQRLKRWSIESESRLPFLLPRPQVSSIDSVDGAKPQSMPSQSVSGEAQPFFNKFESSDLSTYQHNMLYFNHDVFIGAGAPNDFSNQDLETLVNTISPSSFSIPNSSRTPPSRYDETNPAREMCLEDFL